MNKKLFVLICCIISATLFAQQGKNGTLTVTTTLKVNEYSYLTANAAAGNTTITVAGSSLNTHGRFSGNLAPGDLIMIIQVQGAALSGQIDATYGNVGLPDDSSWGAITGYANCGNYELAEVNAVPSGTTIRLDCPLQYSYTATGKVQIVRVPRYSSVTVNSGGVITCDQWDSAIGGIVALEVQGNSVINGSINADSAGFRGGRYYNDADSTGWGVAWYSSTSQVLGKEKGEGIAGYEWSYRQYGGEEGMGAPGNAGGGGNAQNAGGGGGANGGVVANYINGFGNPNISTADNITAYNLEYSWFSKFTSSGGGRGGYSFSGNAENPLVDGPGNINTAWASAWSDDQRRSVGGRGGRPLDYSTGKIFMGGGGGAGDQNNNNGGIGGKGGGIVYLMSYGTVSGSGQIISNGENGFNTHGPATGGSTETGRDAAGGAGAGGTILVNSIGTISGVSLTANGGAGGNQVITNSLTEAEGPGGGGGGGYIAASNTGLTEAATGGANGVTNATPMKNFPPNGATMGGTGTTNASITNFHLTAKNDTICNGSSATLTVSIIGTPSGGITIEWYTKDTGSTPVGTGVTFTTPVLTTTTTYYVGTCPGTYRIPVTVVIKGSSTVTISHDTNICKGSSTTLTATGGTAYSWLPATGLSNAAIATPVATPTATTTYTVSVTTSCGVVKDSVKITVSPLIGTTISANNNQVCAGKSVIITAGGGTGYSWSNSATTSLITVTPTSTTIYTVAISKGGCTKDTSIVITVDPLPVVTITPSNNPVCTGTPTTITATGGSSYTWSNGNTTSSITVSPTSTTTYTVGVSNGSCTKDTSIVITVSSSPKVTIKASNNPVSCGSPTTITATGGSSYTWSNGNTTSFITVNPTATATYSVGISSGGCTKDTDITIIVNPLQVTIKASNNPISCGGSPTTITATGGSSYTWSNGNTTSFITVNPTATATYSVGISSGGCTKDTDITIIVNPLQVTIKASNNPISCGGSPTTITATGGSNYTWSNGNTTSSITVSPIATTTYTVGVSNGGCTKDTDITIIVNPLQVTIHTSNNPILCVGGLTTITATGGSNYTWSNGSTLSSITISPASTTTYTVGITKGGCIKDTDITITVNPTYTTAIKASNNPVCLGSPTTITATNGTSYTWSNGSTTSSITVSPAATTTYSVVVSNGSCTTTDSVVISVDSLPKVTITPSNNPICPGTPISITATGGTSYLWSNNATTSYILVTPALTTTYTVGVSNGNCTKDASIQITVKPAPKITITPDTSICAGNNITLIIGGGGTYLWSNSSTLSNIVVSPATTTTYTAQVTLGGCTKDTAVNVVVNAIPVPLVNGPFPTCTGESVNLNASGGTTYLWKPSSGLNDSVIDNPVATPGTSVIYTVTVYNNTGCSAKDSIAVTVITGASGAACCNGTIPYGGSQDLSVSGAQPGSTYKWSPVTNLTCSTCIDPVASPTVTTLYRVTVTDSNGCELTDSVLIAVDAEGCGDIFVPTAFSPKEKINNTLFVRGGCIASMEFEVFDRWGNRIFSTTDANIGWNGNSNDHPMPMDTYIYYLKVILRDGSIVYKKGNVTLVR